MMGRPRKPGNRDLPPNLYRKHDKRVHKIYYWYKDPMGEEHHWGTDKVRAIQDAIALNTYYAEQNIQQQQKRIDQIIDSTPKVAQQFGVTAKDFGKRYLDHIERQYNQNELAESSYGEKSRYTRLFISRLGSIRMKEITVRDVASVLEEYVADEKFTTAKLIRSSWSLLFKEAQHSGDVDSGFNPALSTRPIKSEVKRSRLFKEQFLDIYDVAKTFTPSYVKHAIKIAVTTGLRRTDIASLTFKDVKDGYLYVATSKSRKKVMIAFPLSMKSPLLEQTLGEIIAECRQKVLSPYLIHFQDRSAKAKLGGQVKPSSLSNHFATLVKVSGISWGKDKTAPTFHELRSLAAQSYNDANEFDEIQNLLGHKSKEMTAKYLDSRQQKVIFVNVG
ncbi:TPA: tyrosine-type recombinase/integrase [Vibrio parahaemolyticus]|uniref:tyrosine-type recombinase/integrase n=1 Tax=Vibrio parahaemolyticus TaxID=670 RepID=UPI00387AF3CB